MNERSANSRTGGKGGDAPFLPARSQSVLLFASVALLALTAPRAFSELERGLEGPWLRQDASERAQFDLQSRSRIQSAGSARAPGLYADVLSSEEVEAADSLQETAQRDQ